MCKSKSLVIAILLLLGANARADEQLDNDINSIVTVADEDAKRYVAEYLRLGAPAKGAAFVGSSIAKNELNALTRNKSLLWPLVRTMTRFAESVEFDNETRQYAFAKLTRLASTDPDAEKTILMIAETISQREGDTLQRAAVSFLQDHRASEARKVATVSEPIRFSPVILDKALPDPSQQGEEERLALLRQSISGAIELLKVGNDTEFFNRFIDPFWIARIGADLGKSEDEVLASMINNRQQIEHFRRQMLTTLIDSMDREPRWLLGGRVASFIGPRGGSHTAEFWIYLNGAWRISPET